MARPPKCPCAAAFGLAPLEGILLRDEAMRRHNGFAPGDLTGTLDLA
ncbi:MAG: hypothetical protein ACTHJP_06380 [Rhodanobacteraceae bacterium]